MSRILKFTTIVGLAMVAGCSQSKIDYEARFDSTVELQWTDAQWVDAVKLLSSGGNFVDTGMPEDPPLDAHHVLPVLKRLGNQFKLEWQAVTEKVNPTQALAILAKVPEGDQSIRDEIEAAIDREQEEFPGAILQQWGHRWVSIYFLDQKTKDAIEEGMKKK